MDNIVIVGSSGHAKVVIDTVEKEGKYVIVGLIDRFRSVGDATMGYPVLGGDFDLPAIVSDHNVAGVVVAVGDNFVRSQIVYQISDALPNIPFVSTVHPRTSIASDVIIGPGTVILSGVTVNSSSTIGSFCILNTHSSLDHDSCLSDYGSLAPGVVTGGNCRIGHHSAISIGATLKHNIEIGAHSVIGAGAVVLRSIPSFSVAVGVPAKVVRTRTIDEKYLS